MKMTKPCKGKTKQGKPCPNMGGASGYCFIHDPARGEERAKARRLGGQRQRAAHSATDPAQLPQKVRTLEDVLTVLDYALAEAVPLDNSVQRGRLLVGIAHAFIEAIKVGELEQRLAAIEAALKIGDSK